MNKVLLFVALFLYFVSTVCSGRLFVITAKNGDGLGMAHALTNVGFNVHGFYEDLLVITTENAKLHEIIADMSATVHHYAELNDNVRYFVLERPERAFITFNEPVQVSEDFLTVVYSSHNRIVVSAPASRADFVHHSLSGDLEILPVDTSAPVYLGIRRELLPIISAVYANATKQYLQAPNPVITKLVGQVNPSTLKSFVTYLSGEDASSNILTRNSRSQGAKDAQAWIQDRFAQFGLTVTTHQFNTLYSSNVIGVRRGVTDPNKVVVIGAHYDSRGPDVSSATQRAPGANDNGSGTGAILQIAKIFNDSAAKLDYTVHFIVYSGEEQGLLGSAAYATQLVNDRVSVIGVLNADMIAFHVPSEPTQCAFPSRYSTPDLEVIARTATLTYVPELTIGITTACCSDHQSYYNRGLPATGFFERNGAIADNQYHKSEDLVSRSGYDIDGQYTQLVKAALATLATLAGAQ